MSDATESIFITKQPVFDRDISVWGYEFNFRIPENNCTLDPALADTIDSLNPAIQNAILDNTSVVCLHKQSTCDMGFPTLDGDHAVTLPNLDDPTLLCTKAEALKASGSLIILDATCPREAFEAALKDADMVKVSVKGMAPIDVVKERKRFKGYEGKLIASDIEDWVTYEGTKALGFKYFQGAFFTTPEIRPNAELNASSLAKLQLLRELNMPDADPKRLAEIIGTDVSLSYRLLRYINSAAFNLTNKIKSIQQAVALLGLLEIRKWAMIVVMSEMDDTPRGDELSWMVLQRARFLERMSDLEKVSYTPGTMFMLGLFSRLDALLNHHMSEALEHLPLEDDMKAALLGEKNGMRDWLDMLDHAERSNWHEANAILEKYGACLPKAALAYLRASKWASQQISGLH